MWAPRINKALIDFDNTWNNHSIRTAHHHTPQQLFTCGILLLQHSSMDALDFLDDVDDYYGYDDNGPTSAEEPEGVHVPRSTLKFSESDLTALKDAVDPIAPSSEYGNEQTVECISNFHPL